MKSQKLARRRAPAPPLLAAEAHPTGLESALRLLANGPGVGERYAGRAADELVNQLVVVAYRMLFMSRLSMDASWRRDWTAFMEASSALYETRFRTRFWSPHAIPDLQSIRVDKRTYGAVLNALDVLAPAPWSMVAEAYEALLSLVPTCSLRGTLDLTPIGGNDRKTSGSYYTPQSLIECLLDTAMTPLMSETMTVCDPACGSGHFLVAAARRLPRRRRSHFIRHQLYGVDINPIAAELCRMALWLEANDPTWVMHEETHPIRCGNSLLGAEPALLEQGLPDAAFAILDGDDKEVVLEARRRNQQERLSGDWPVPKELNEFAADAWCAAFILPRTRGGVRPITHSIWVRWARGERPAEYEATRAAVLQMKQEHGFVHFGWHFADVLKRGGFDVVLGNPPWERLELQDREWFQRRHKAIAEAPHQAERQRRVERLRHEDPALYQRFQDERRRMEATSHFIRQSGRFPLTGRGGINTYAVFAETKRRLLAPHGRVGCIVPSGIATDDLTRHFFRDLVEKGSLVNMAHFDNRARLFPAVGSMITFSLLTLAGRGSKRPPQGEFVCFAHTVDDLNEPGRRFTLSADDLTLFNPNTGTFPVFRSERDARLTRAIYRRVPILLRQSDPVSNPWRLRLSMMFQMAGDSHLFESKPGQGLLPLYEAKMLHHYDHRWAEYARGSVVSITDKSPGRTVTPRYYVPAEEVECRLADRWSRPWLLAFRDICRSTDERTAISCFLPRVGVGHTAQLMLADVDEPWLLQANIASLVFDYVARQKVGGIHLTYAYVYQLPVLPPEIYRKPCPWGRTRLGVWVAQRILELSYTALDLKPLARDMGCKSAPFAWDEERRAHLRAELDAAYFLLYGLGREDVVYVLGTFPGLRRKEEARYGVYRTAELVLEYYDRLAGRRAKGR